MKLFYFVSDSSEVMNLLFFFTRFFSNFHIPAVLTIFLHRKDDLLLKYDMMIFHPGNYPVSGYFYRIFLDFFKSSNFESFARFLQAIDYEFLKYDMIVVFSCNLYDLRIFFRIFFQIFSRFFQISPRNFKSLKQILLKN